MCVIIGVLLFAIISFVFCDWPYRLIMYGNYKRLESIQPRDNGTVICAVIHPFKKSVLTYTPEGGEPDRISALIEHERVHLEQLERDGRIVFLFKYFYYNVRYGYHGNPYEHEAEERSGFYNE